MFRDLTKDEISCRVQQVSEKGCSLLLYKTARVDSQILDEVYGRHNWTNDFKVINNNLFCGIGIREDKDSDFVWKWDCGTESMADKEKGEASDAFKRAAFKWGIGVELYSSPFIFVKVETEKDKNNKWQLKDKFNKFSIGEINCKDKKITKLKIVDKNDKVVFSFGTKNNNEEEKKNQENKPDDVFSKEEKEVIFSDNLEKWLIVISKASDYEKLKMLFDKWKNKFPKGSESYEKLLDKTNERKKEVCPTQ